MLLKLIGFVFIVLVFLGLGLGGTFKAALAGYHTIESNPIIHQLENKATNEIKSGAGAQLHNVENGISHTVVSKFT